jgi:predicted ester cyclase
MGPRSAQEAPASALRPLADSAGSPLPIAQEGFDGHRREQEARPSAVRRNLERANWATVDELYAFDYVNHDPYNPDQEAGPEGFRQRVRGYRSVLHNFDLRIERQLAEGALVETQWSLRGTHGGPLEGAAPTGRSVQVDGQLLSRIVDGRFVEEWVHWDTLACSARSAPCHHPPPDRQPSRQPTRPC